MALPKRGFATQRIKADMTRAYKPVARHGVGSHGKLIIHVCVGIYARKKREGIRLHVFAKRTAANNQSRAVMVSISMAEEIDRRRACSYGLDGLRDAPTPKAPELGERQPESKEGNRKSVRFSMWCSRIWESAGFDMGSASQGGRGNHEGVYRAQRDCSLMIFSSAVVTPSR